MTGVVAEITQVVLISEDALGPCRKSLLVRFSDGSPRTLERMSAIRSFVQQLQSQRPKLAQAIHEAVNEPHSLSNYERVLYDATKG